MAKKPSFTPKSAHMSAELSQKETQSTEDCLLPNAIRIAQNWNQQLSERANFLTLLTKFINSLDSGNNNDHQKMELLCGECDVIFECKTCRELFRSFEHFSQHKNSATCSSRTSNLLASKEYMPTNQELNLSKQSILQLYDQYTTVRMNKVAEVTESFERSRKSMNYSTPSRSVYSSQKRSNAAKSQKTSALIRNSPQKPILNLIDATDIIQTNAQSDSKPGSAECPICHKKLVNFNGVRRHLLSMHSTSVKKVNTSSKSGHKNVNKENDDTDTIKNNSANKVNKSAVVMKENLSAIINQSNNGSSEENLSSNYFEEILVNENPANAIENPVAKIDIVKTRNLTEKSAKSDVNNSFYHPTTETREHDYCGAKFSTALLAHSTEKLQNIENSRKLNQVILNTALDDHFLW